MATLHHRVECGPTVVPLHAGVADLRMWDAQGALLAAPLVRTVPCDLRGSGESGLEPETSYADAEDVLALLDELGVADCRSPELLTMPMTVVVGAHDFAFFDATARALVAALRDD